MTGRRDPAPLDAATLRAMVLADVEAEGQRVRAAEAEHRAALTQLATEAAQLRAEHDKAAAAARATYAAAPPMPELPDGQPHRDALHALLRARAALTTRRVQILAAALPEIVLAWDAARPLLDERAREIATQATALAEEYAAWWRLLRDARRANETSDPNKRVRNGPSERMRPRPTAVDVLAAATGIDLCGVGPSDVDVRVQLVTGRVDDGTGRVPAR